jgi:organic hydroperoxide reductase OsmC/OhrA
MRAAQQGIDPGRIEVMVDSVSDDRGILGLVSDVPAGPLSARVAVRFTAARAGGDQLEELATWAVDHCPVTDAVRRAVPLSVEVSVEP